MRLIEMTVGQNFTINVHIGENSLFFQSVVREIMTKKNFILADAVIRDGKPVSLRGKNVVVDLLFTPESDEIKPLIFKNVTSTLVKKNTGEYFYTFTTLAEGLPFNRREHFRCYVGIPSSLQCSLNSKACNALIKDVSSSGFAVVCDESVVLTPGQLVHTVLNDQPRTNGETFNFHLYGLVQRSQSLDNGKILYGCRLNEPVNGLDRYIMEKERARLKRRGGWDL